jgi:hypothetical protein
VAQPVLSADVLPERAEGKAWIDIGDPPIPANVRLCFIATDRSKKCEKGILKENTEDRGEGHF